MVHPPLLLEKKQRREKPALQLAGGGEGAGRREEAPHVGARAGRRARGGGEGAGGARVPEKKKKSRSFLLISRQPHRVSGRARDFQRARRPGFSGGPGNPGESPARAFPGSAGVLHGEGVRFAA